MTTKDDAARRVRDFIEQWPSHYGPMIYRAIDDTGENVDLNLMDLIVLTTPEPVPAPLEEYAIEIPVMTPGGLVEGWGLHLISVEHGRKFLKGDFKLGFRESLLWRPNPAAAWQVEMVRPWEGHD